MRRATVDTRHGNMMHCRILVRSHLSLSLESFLFVFCMCRQDCATIHRDGRDSAISSNISHQPHTYRRGGTDLGVFGRVISLAIPHSLDSNVTQEQIARCILRFQLRTYGTAQVNDRRTETPRAQWLSPTTVHSVTQVARPITLRERLLLPFWPATAKHTSTDSRRPIHKRSTRSPTHRHS